MATVTTTHWACDRCGAKEDARPALSTPRITIRIEIEEEWHTQIHNWKELCDRCNRHLLSEYKVLTRRETTK